MKRFFIFLAAALLSGTAFAQNVEVRVREQLPVTSPRTLIVEMNAVGVASPVVGDQLLDFTMGLKYDPANNSLGAIDNTAGYSMSKFAPLSGPGGTEIVPLASSDPAGSVTIPMNWDGWTEIFKIEVTGTEGDLIEVAAQGDNAGSNPSLVFLVGSTGALVVDAPVPNGSAILPITLSKFNAIKAGERGADLLWESSSEINSSHFTVLRSYDGAEWNKIGEVEAQGNSTEAVAYKFEDRNIPLTRSGQNIIYYKLDMVDLDGASEETEVRSVRLDATGKVTFTTYPNPVVNSLNVEVSTDVLSAQYGDNATLSIYDNAGALLLKRSISNSGVARVDVQDIPAGVLNVEVKYGKETFSSKIIKVD